MVWTALATRRPCERIWKDHEANRVFPQLLGRPGVLEVSRAAVPSSPGRAGCCAEGPREVAALTFERARVLLRQRPGGALGAGRSGRSALLRAVPRLPAALYAAGKGQVVYAVVKEGENLRGTAWQCAGVICYFPVTKGHRRQPPTCVYGLDGRPRVQHIHRGSSLEISCDLKQNPQH